uniref:tRNA (adenine(37)-N6)-methyltransferase n=1 Tax=Leptobrachium leishanense TaxID=445787 RepID=A0A8C5WC27_9ANUR
MEGNAGPMTYSLETGNILTTPIGYIESCFKTKNGTPRQPSVCSLSRACLRISKSVFNNPEHSLMGLEEFSHVWVLFVFHKNGRLSCKAKVQPPRLNGAKTGVFSTRSPHRPNAIGLTLARLEKVEGGTLYLSGIDMIQGTPVLDIKPYISEYDSPKAMVPCQNDSAGNEENNKATVSCRDEPNGQMQTVCHQFSNKTERETIACINELPHIPLEPQEREKVKDLNTVFNALSSFAIEDISTCDEDASSHLEDDLIPEPSSFGVTCLHETKDACKTDSFVPSWVKHSPVANLKVRFTPNSEMELRQFQAPGDSGAPSLRYFKSIEEAKCAISTVLSADPRSVYRRKQCQDRLFYFSLDTIHITCWFGDGFAEVLKVQSLDSCTESLK